MAKKECIAVIDFEKCKGCGLCVSHCKQGLIIFSAKTNNNGYHFAVFSDQERKCIGCKNCALVCPDTIISIKKTDDAS